MINKAEAKEKKNRHKAKKKNEHEARKNKVAFTRAIISFVETQLIRFRLHLVPTCKQNDRISNVFYKQRKIYLPSSL